MGVLEDVVINAKSAAETVGKEAGRLVDISKLRFGAAELQKEISRKYETLGRMVYDCRKSGNSVDLSFDEHVQAIDSLYQKLDEINEKINVLRKKTVCPKCGFNNDEKSLFCSRCGTKLGEPVNAQPSSKDEGETAGPGVNNDSI